MSQQPKEKPAQPAQAPKIEHIRGVFSTQEIRKVGTGTTTRKTVQKMFWFIEQQPNGDIECQPLNSNYVPTGAKKKLSLQDLIEKYAPEPEFYYSAVYSKLQELKQSVDSGDEHREQGHNFTAEHVYDEVLKVDEDNIRANFGIGLTYLQRGDEEKAQNIFDRLVNLDAAFEEEHKHLFNDFGINLRKNKMTEQSIAYYLRALELSKVDENLHMNMARAYFDNKDYENCVKHLLTALTLEPKHESSLKFLEWLKGKNLIPRGQENDVYKFLNPKSINLDEETMSDLGDMIPIKDTDKNKTNDKDVINID